MRPAIVRALTLAVVVLAVGCAGPGAREPDYAGGGRASGSAAEINTDAGIAYMRQGRNDIALRKLRRALSQDPDLARAHNAIAVLYARLGESALADRHYRRALALDPDDPKIRNNYGQFLCYRGAYAEADEHFRAAVANPLYANRATAYTNAGICARQAGDLARAEAYFRRALELDPLYDPALLQMARVRVNQERWLQARAYVQRYHEAAGHSEESLRLGIQIERALGDADAVASYELMLRARSGAASEDGRPQEDETP